MKNIRHSTRLFLQAVLASKLKLWKEVATVELKSTSAFIVTSSTE